MKLGKLIDLGIPIFGGALLGIVVMLIFLQIVLRECFNFSLNWSDEIAQFCMTWLVLFGAIWVTKNDQHLKTGLKPHNKLNERHISLIDGIIDLIIAFIAAGVAYQTAIFAFITMGAESLSLPWLKMGYVFIALPLFMLAVVYYYLKSFFKNITRIFKKG